MARTVFCKKYQQQLPGLNAPPYPGPKGQDIFEQVSQKAWQEWQKHQTMLINERHLSMMDAKDRTFLQEQMDKFLSGQDYELAEGYVPENK
ncbi:oxidative damage protection protein [Dasania marina]|uniref:oxidative damage protection protein n=1 Tax=Dasania marina TaxID=471499 RepID=UPI000367232D|nr:oxidative damage protection protein [Dasania marina]|tara:strand:+ start:26423 stop:26695 length:273 start_codon:yes stop_codon:yes gene_type:complete